MITSKTISNGILRAVITLTLCGLVLFFFYKIQSVIIYLIVSLILTLIGNPILDFFKKRLKFNHVFATIATLFIFILIIFGFIMMFIPLILSQGQNLSLLNTVEIEKDLALLINQITVFLDSHSIDSAQVLKEANITSKINFNFIPDFLNSLLGTISSFGMGLASVLFITFFFLKDRKIFILGARDLIPNSHEDQILNSLEKTNHL
ncbi:MAG TPA: AI-2E family transporter, partial [Flavobacterium sp.]|nr:AI-2E family transporter [Flavobacterium sp.]